MSDRCEPPPELRNVDGWHIVKCADEYRMLKWIAYLGQWDIHPEHVSCALSSKLWTYCFCLPTPSELAAAKEREAALVRELDASRAMQHAPDLYAALAEEIYRAVEKHTDEPDILCIIGSWRDTLPDADILAMLRDYNQTGRALSDAKPN